MATKTIWNGLTNIAVTAGDSYDIQGYVRIKNNSNNEINLPQLNSMYFIAFNGVDFFPLSSFTQITSNVVLDTWIRLRSVFTSNVTANIKVGLFQNTTSVGTNIEGNVDDCTVTGPLITRDLPYANNRTGVETNKISKLETEISNKLLSLSGKEKITASVKGYLSENSVYSNSLKQYIVTSQSIDEMTDVNSIQLLEI